jgi:DNA replication protein DnaC
LEIIDRMTEPGLLVIDELQERGETAFEDRLLTHLIDARYGAKRPTILIANLSKDELGKSLGPSIVDRASENGRRIDFTWNSYRRA